MTNNSLQLKVSSFLSADNMNAAAIAKVEQYLPELQEKTRAFDRKNSQTSLTLMSLTMLNGHSKYRLLRQILAEADKRKAALAESQVNHAKLVQEINRLSNATDPVEKADYSNKCITLQALEGRINGSFKDLAVLIDAYLNIKEKHNIKDWDEKAFEAEEKRFHVRRAFELMYRNLIVSGRTAEATVEYCQQFGIHPQICFKETAHYIAIAADKLEQSENIHANDLEEWLDSMGDKYVSNVDKTAERLFGKAEFANSDYMYQMMKEKARN